MIVHILPPANGFPAVNYNTNKIDRNKGELMKTANFGALGALQQLRPEDYKRHLRMLSATNQRVKRPQFHAVISSKGKEYDKDELTCIAEKWLGLMGYGSQPYLIVFHKDTGNNHVHMVSSRIDHKGKKISDGFENNRAVQHLNEILGVHPKNEAQADLQTALSYNFSTRAQFMMILESKGYVLKETAGILEIIKFGQVQAETSKTQIEEHLKTFLPDLNRKKQLKALFLKYAQIHSTALVKERTGYSSAFAGWLKEKFGILLLFHYSADKAPYGYTIIDHAGKAVFKGGEIMALQELMDINQVINATAQIKKIQEVDIKQENTISENKLNYYGSILKAALYNYPDLIQGLYHQGLIILHNGGNYSLHDPVTGDFIGLDELLSHKDYQLVLENFRQTADNRDIFDRQHHHLAMPNLAGDIDDEAINGRNRRRKKQVRTNSR